MYFVIKPIFYLVGFNKNLLILTAEKHVDISINIFADLFHYLTAYHLQECLEFGQYSSVVEQAFFVLNILKVDSNAK
jgi:hypothetical protein